MNKCLHILSAYFSKVYGGGNKRGRNLEKEIVNVTLHRNQTRKTCLSDKY